MRDLALDLGAGLIEAAVSAIGRCMLGAVMIALLLFAASGCSGPASRQMTESDYFPREIVTGPRAWALACSAVLVERNCNWHDSLAMTPLEPAPIEITRKAIEEWWDITDRDSLMNRLERLESGGHRKRFEEIGNLVHSGNVPLSVMLGASEEQLNKIQIAYKYYHEVGEKGIIGWDFSRAIFLCRAAYSSGYICEDEAWELIMRYAGYIQETFDSWEELGRNYLIGRQFWSKHNTLRNGDEYYDAFIVLTETTSSPWNRLSWDMDLTDWEAK